MEILNDQDTAEIYFEALSLPPDCYPAHIYREDGITYVFFDPLATRLDLAMWTQQHLTPAEATTTRRAYGQPQRGEAPMSDDMLEGVCGEAVADGVRPPTAAEVTQAIRELAEDARREARRAVEISRLTRSLRACG